MCTCIVIIAFLYSISSLLYELIQLINKLVVKSKRKLTLKVHMLYFIGNFQTQFTQNFSCVVSLRLNKYFAQYYTRKSKL